MNIVTKLIERIEDYRLTNKQPCKNYATEAAAEKATAKMAKAIAEHFCAYHLGWEPPLIITRVMLDEVNMQYVITDQKGSFVAKTYSELTAMAIQQLPQIMSNANDFITILKHVHPYISDDSVRADIGGLIVRAEAKPCQH